MQLFIVGTVGLIGSDDVLACFIAGNVFTWDDWFRVETQDDSLQPTIDFLLNMVIFLWYGAVLPWHYFVTNPVVPIYRLIPLGILVLLFRRLPMVLTLHYFGVIHQIQDIRHAFFVGFFGPIGVSAIFYLYISREFLRKLPDRPDATQVSEVIDVVVWFLVLCSIVVHGLSIPLGKLGLYLPRSISTAISLERPSASQSRARDETGTPNQASGTGVQGSHGGPRDSSPAPLSMHWVPAVFVRFFKNVGKDFRRPQETDAHSAKDREGQPQSETSADSGEADGLHNISSPTNARPIGNVIPEPQSEKPAAAETGTATPQQRRGDFSPSIDCVAVPAVSIW